LPSGGNTVADEKEKVKRVQEIKQKQAEVDPSREQEDRILHDTSKRRVSGFVQLPFVISGNSSMFEHSQLTCVVTLTLLVNQLNQ
jgi:hypothetical protein